MVASVNDNPSDTANTVGAYQGGDQHFAQTIDDVYIYQSALDAGQVAGLVGGGNPPATNPIPDGSSVDISAAGTLDMSGFSETIGDLTGAGAVTNSNAARSVLTLGGDNASTTFAGILGDGISKVAVTKVGSGIFTLQGANTYTGGTSILAGSVALAGGTNRLSTGGAVDVEAGAVLDLGNQSQTVAALTGAGTVVNSPAVSTSPTLTVNFASGTETFAGVLGVPGESAFNLSKAGSGNLVLAGANGYSGTTSIVGGALSVSSDANLGAAPTTFTANAITLSNSASLVATASFALNANRGITLGSGGGVINTAPINSAPAAALTYTGLFTGETGLKKVGSGALILTNAAAGTAIGTLEIQGARSSTAVRPPSASILSSSTLSPRSPTSAAPL